MAHGGDLYNKNIKYDFSVNLNPMDLPVEIKEAMDKSLSEAGIYPDIEQREFRRNIARLEHVSEDEVLGGNGASEIIMGVVRAINPKRALILAPTFSGYRYALESIEGCEIKEVRLEKENDYKVDNYILSLVDEFVDVVFICNPNNPTGKCMDDYLLDNLINRAYSRNVNVVVDECFLPLADKGKSVAGMVKYLDNLYVIKAFTKSFAIPALRIGYLISNEDNIKRVKGKLPEWNMSGLALKVGKECARASKETKFISKSKELISKEREYLSNELKKLNIKVYDSDVNFILISSDNKLYDLLLQRGILIRDCSDYSGLNGKYRIAVKNHKENEYLIETLKEILAGNE